MQARGVSTPGQENPSISSHVIVNAGRVAADPGPQEELLCQGPKDQLQAIWSDGSFMAKQSSSCVISGAMGNFIRSD